MDEEDTELDPLLAAHVPTTKRSLFSEKTEKQGLIELNVEAWLEEYEKEKQVQEEKKMRELEIEYAQKIKNQHEYGEEVPLESAP